MRLALIDQRWHPKREILMAGAALIPPVKALQYVEYQRKWKSQKLHGEAKERMVDYDRVDAIRSGAFLLALKTLHSEISRYPKKYELDGEMIRWKPLERKDETI
jgi:hypothetical protein